jgi:hypothetical protein
MFNNTRWKTDHGLANVSNVIPLRGRHEEMRERKGHPFDEQQVFDEM